MCSFSLVLFRKRSNSWLSTGWFTMAIAVEICDRINVYGMIPPEFCKWDFLFHIHHNAVGSLLCILCFHSNLIVFWWFMTISVTHVTVLLRSPNLEPSVPYHYYEPAGPDECKMYLSHEQGRHGSHHRFITEKRVFANWARMFNIHFYQPYWRPAPVTKNSTDSWGSNTGVFLGLRTSVSFWGQNLNIWTGTHYE